MSTPIDPAWRAVPKGKSCLLIWRIEQLEVKPVPKDQVGSFYTGDAYIVLASSSVGGQGLDSHIHFWLGSKSSQDERGCAAIKSVELDDYLGGAPVQHREVEGAESAQFLRYFPQGIRYMEGGVKSGFNHVTRPVINRLLHVKGKHNVRVREIEIGWENMNEGDVFVLDLNNILFVWMGKHSSRTERLKGMETARKVRDERGGRAIIRDVQDGTEDKDLLDATEYEMFNAALPLKKKRVHTAAEGGQDEKVERLHSAGIKLYVCREESGTLKVTEVKPGPLLKSDLDSNDSFIIDNGPAGIWVWNGKRASKLERQQAMRNAEGFLKKKGYPNSTQIHRVSEGGEPYMFKSLFRRWPESQPTGKTFQYNKIARTVQTRFDASTLHSDRRLAATTQMVDDGSGQLEIYRVERVDHGGAARYDLVPISRKTYGQFFGGDCYELVYTYNVHGRQNVIIYFWQGLKSTQDEKGASAYHAQELDNVKYHGAAVQVRVVQNKEPPHFMAMFQGRMIIFEGGKAGWGDGQDQVTLPDTFLVQVRGISQYDTKAVQVDLTAESLNSNDVFVLFCRAATFIWAGKGSTGDEREMAREVASKWSTREVDVVVEGQEPREFWDAIGGRKPYANDRRLQEEAPSFEPRLFQASNASGRFLVDEIPNFTQNDLVSDDVMILDVWDAIYVWIGEGANRQERELAVQAAVDYIRTDPSGRDPDTPIYQIKQGFEPPSFTGFFGVWDNDLWNRGRTWEQLKTELSDSNQGLKLVVQKSPEANGHVSFAATQKFPYETLLLKEGQGLPEAIDPSCKEVHLTPEDFRRVFKMTYEEFMSLPQWKQHSLKKDAGLF